jgi:hypothetical protein
MSGSQSHALVEVKSEFMQPEAFNDCSVFDDQLKFSLADTYMNFNMRDSYLQR